MTKTLKWILCPFGVFPGFCEPIFEEDDNLFVQIDESSKVIKGFETILLEPESTLRETENRTYSIGESRLFAFFTQSDVIVGDYDALKAYFIDNIDQYKRTPFLFLEIADFIEDQKFIQEAHKLCISDIVQISTLSELERPSQRVKLERQNRDAFLLLSSVKDILTAFIVDALDVKSPGRYKFLSLVDDVRIVPARPVLRVYIPFSLCLFFGSRGTALEKHLFASMNSLRTNYSIKEFEIAWEYPRATMASDAKPFERPQAGIAGDSRVSKVGEWFTFIYEMLYPPAESEPYRPKSPIPYERRMLPVPRPDSASTEVGLGQQFGAAP
jgi:hypothetical protein